MTDQELDMLLAESVQRSEVVEQINCQVMKTVRRDMRLKALRKWAKLLGICFGVPVMIVLYVYILITYMPAMETPLRVIALALPLGTMLVFLGKQFYDFSPFEM